MIGFMSDAADRLRALRIKKGFSNPIDAARAYGWNEHTYKAHENGLRGIRIDAARKYAAAFGSTPAHILGIGSGNGQVAEKHPVNHVVQVPVIARVSAGTFRYDEPIEYEGEAVPAVLRSDLGSASQYSVIIDGPSVNKRIPDGAFAICVPLNEFPGGAQHGQLVHVVRERAGLFENTIKELRYGSSGTTLVPVSTDPRYQEPVQLSTGDDGEIVRILGIVVGAFIPV
jgi:DNA-binding XRE family transcriptional regulator